MTETPAKPAAGPPAPGSAGAARRLLILTSLPALRDGSGQWLLPAKFVSGVQAYVQRWPGPVTVALQPGGTPTGDLDNRYWAPSALPFALGTVDYPTLARQGDPLLDGAVVLALMNHRLYGLAAQCRARGAVLVLNAELALTTQLQIARTTHAFGWKRWKSMAWLLLNHRRALREIRAAHGLQCNGTPAYDTLGRHSPAPLRYFDNRTTRDRCSTPADLDARFAALQGREHLRLFFSGRLHPIKGVDALVPLALSLRRRGVRFELWIAGDGPLRQTLQARIEAEGLQTQVRLLGTLDFEREIQPLLRTEIDLFVCPHVQGDPSCTYLETLCAGVPIVGYPNEAWQGLHRLVQAGHVCRAADPEALADGVMAVAREPAALRAHADRALAFATQHTFEAEFDRRIDHLRRLGGLAEPAA